MLFYLQCLLVERRRDERGASAVEYGLLIAAIAAVVVGNVLFYSFLLNGIFGGYCREANGGQPC